MNGADETQKARILVVEDCAINRLAVTASLKAAGYIVDEAKNGREAVELITASAHDLVLLDMELPYMNGLEVLEHVRSGGCGQDKSRTGIVMLSGHCSPQDRKEWDEAGANGFLEKPIPVDILREVIPRYLFSS